MGNATHAGRWGVAGDYMLDMNGRRRTVPGDWGGNGVFAWRIRLNLPVVIFLFLIFAPFFPGIYSRF